MPKWKVWIKDLGDTIEVEAASSYVGEGCLRLIDAGRDDILVVPLTQLISAERLTGT